jgi:hypothetical protein
MLRFNAVQDQHGFGKAFIGKYCAGNKNRSDAGNGRSSIVDTDGFQGITRVIIPAGVVRGYKQHRECEKDHGRQKIMYVGTFFVYNSSRILLVHPLQKYKIIFVLASNNFVYERSAREISP